MLMGIIMGKFMDNTTLLWIAGILFTVIGSLVGVIWAIAWGAIKELRGKINILEETINDKNQQLSNITITEFSLMRKELSERCHAIYDKLDEERKERIDKHDKAIERVFIKIDSIQQTVTSSMTDVNNIIADIREAVAGFGSIYATRKEWIEGCPKSPRHLQKDR